jgi:hypothetical protein
MRSSTHVGFIGGAGHSGSTLLGLMLGAHREIFYAGEARKSSFLGDTSKPIKKRVCKLCGPACAVWGSLAPPFVPDVYEVVSHRTGKSIVIDSTKSLEWIDAQVADLGGRGVALSLFFLARDGRAVVNSRVRKYPETPVRDHAAAWVAQLTATEALAERFPGRVLRVRYEALATDPEPRMRECAALLGVAFDRAMLAPWTTEQHPLGGNNGTQSLMRRAEGSVVELGDKTRDWYGGRERGISLDLRWRHELGAAALAEFEEIAGEANEPYAWDGDGGDAP